MSQTVPVTYVVAAVWKTLADDFVTGIGICRSLPGSLGKDPCYRPMCVRTFHP